MISTFVSRYFSHDVPGIMTRVRLPPDPGNSCITTIVDSQGGDAALISAVAALTYQTSESSLQSLLERAEGAAMGTPMEGGVSLKSKTTSLGSSLASPRTTGIEHHVDSIVLVYDLDRVETFFRLERHWLPLIERCYKGKVRMSYVVCCVVLVCQIRNISMALGISQHARQFIRNRCR